MTEFLADLQLADMDNQMPKALKRLRKVDLLIVDDFLLTSTNSTEQKYLMEVFESRDQVKPLILCSQMNIAEWHKKLGGGTLADAVLDRVVSKSHHIIISGESQRK